MKKAIRVIDLFNTEKDNLPKRIKIDDTIYNLFINEDNLIYYQDEDCKYFMFSISCFNKLNDEVEIIEEDKKIEKLNIESVKDNPTNMYIINEYGTKCYMTKHSREIALKVNELIDVVNELKGKSE